MGYIGLSACYEIMVQGLGLKVQDLQVGPLIDIRVI